MESLYRKYRPQTFDSMVGQKHIVKTLENAFAEGRTAHAYLFSGPRGTGKTTTARLLAKALLCEAGPTPHPDGTCEQCEAIAAGTHPDVYELDAASRTGVDNVREEIINRVAFAPTRGRYKIYIIDEVHMLTTQAFNALLKTLEEPPAHVVFVLCTTDPQKVPDTILSRCQRLEFHRIGLGDIEERLEYVCTSEGFSYDAEALKLVAKHARGGLRDALSTLEQLSVFGGGAVRLEDACNVLGEVPDDTLATMARMVANRDVAGCFAQVADLAERGVDVPQYTRDLTRFVRNVYVASVAGAQGFEDPAAAGDAVALAAEMGGPDRIASMLDVLGRLESELRTSLDQRLSLEVALTRMARPASDLTLESLAVRVADLERELADLRANGVPAGVGGPVPAGAGGATSAGRPAGAAVAGEKPWARDGHAQPAGAARPAGSPTPGMAGRQTPPAFVSRSAGGAQGSTAAARPVSPAGGMQGSADATRSVSPANGMHGGEKAGYPAPSAAPGRPAPAPAMAPTSGMPAVTSASGMPATTPASGTPAVTPAMAPASGMPAVTPAMAPASGMPAAARVAVPVSSAPPAVAPAAPCAPTAAQQLAATGATSMDAGEIQRLWARVVEATTKANVSVGALLRNADGVLSDDGTLTVTNRGAAFAAQMLARPSSLEVLARVAGDVYGRPVRIAIAGTGAPAGGARPAGSAAAPVTPAAAAAPAPSRPSAAAIAAAAAAAVNGSQPPARPAVAASVTQSPARPAAVVTNSPVAPMVPAPAFAPATPASAAMPVSPAAPVVPAARPPMMADRAVSATPAAGLSAPVPVASATAAPAPAPGMPATVALAPASGMPASAAPAMPSAPASAASRAAGSSPATPQSPGYDFVPDEVYDSYGDPYDEEPPTPNPQAAAVAALSGASSGPIASPSSPAGAAAGGEPEMTPPWVTAPAAPTISQSAVSPSSSSASVCPTASAAAPVPQVPHPVSAAPAASAPRPATPVPQASQPAAPAPTPAVPTPAAPASEMDSSAIDLAQMLSAGFGGYVKVTPER